MRKLLLLLFSLLVTFEAHAQVSVTGQIRGTVSDPSGASVVGANVNVSGLELATSRSTKTSQDGGFLVDKLAPGTYKVTITAPGFQQFVQENIVISSGFTATLSSTLVLGQEQQAVIVTASAPVVDTQANATSTTFDNALLQGVPSGRDTFSQVAQVPGVTSSNFDVGGNQSFQQSSMEVHGSIPGEQVYSFNGLRLNWPGSTGGYTSFYVDQDALQEFQVITDSAPAEVAVGGVYMNMVPKSGTNQIHGLAAAYYESAGTQATIDQPEYNGSKVSAGSPIIMSRDLAANAGGPLIRDKWWIFGAWRYYLVKESILSVLTPPNGAPATDPNHQTNTLLRSDFKLNSNNTLNFVWWYNAQNRFFRRDTAFAFVYPEAAWRQIEPAYILQGQWTSIVKNFIFDSRIGYMHQIFPLGYQPGITNADFNREDTTLSTETGAPPYEYINPAQSLAFSEAVSYYKGHWLGASHNFKFGFDFSTNRNGYIYQINQGINAIYNNGVPSFIIAYNSPLDQKSIYHESALYAQDSLSFKRHWTLNLGVRYSHFNTFNPKQSSPAATFPDLFPDRTFPQSADYVVWNTVRPRLGVTWDPTGKGKSVVRASFGQYDVIEGTEVAETLNPNGLSYQEYTWNDTNGDGIPQQGEWLLPQNLVASSGGLYTHVDSGLKRPYSDAVNVGYQQELFGGVNLGINYYYRTTRNWYAERNLAAPTSDYTAVQTTNPLTNKPLTLYNLAAADVGQANYVITNISDLNNNHFNALEITARKQMSKRWQLLAGYTLQQKKGTYRRGLTDDFNNPNNNVNRADSVLDYDATNVFKVDWTYVAPWRISFSGNYQFYTGYPLDPNNGPPQGVFSEVTDSSGNTTTLNQGQVNVILEPLGTLRLPNVSLLNFRLSRPTALTDRFQLEPIVDLFNVADASTVTGKASTYGPNFLRPTDQMLNPFIARFALRLTF